MDFKYIKFFFTTVLKLLMFLVLCFGAAFLCRRANYPLSSIAPPLPAACFTFIFLTAAEGGGRSFFCKGYLLENMIPGALWGLGAAAAGPLLGLGLGALSLHALPDSFDIRDNLYYACGTGLFLSVVIFGYFFHIIQMDFGGVPAVIISALLYGTVITAQGGYFSSADPRQLALTIAYFALIGTAPGLLILNLGDMRSAAAFLFMESFCSSLADDLTSGNAGDFAVLFAKPVIALLCAVTMFAALNKKD